MARRCNQPTPSLSHDDIEIIADVDCSEVDHQRENECKCSVHVCAVMKCAGLLLDPVTWTYHHRGDVDIDCSEVDHQHDESV